MSDHEFFLHQNHHHQHLHHMMPIDVDCLTIEDLEMLLHIQRKKVAREAEAKRLAEEAECKAERVAAAAAAQKAEEEAKEKARRVKKAVEVVGSGSDMEPGPSQKKGKGEVRAESVESVEELGDARGKLLVFGLFCALLLTVGRCRNNKIACIWGSICRKACAACEGQTAMWCFWGRGEAASSRVRGIGGGDDYPSGHH
jgi:hypothetical protein